LLPRREERQGLLDHLANANTTPNPSLHRWPLKLATGAGKTTVMAMLIAWQTIKRRRATAQQAVHAGLPGRGPA
jgi:type III restriction enzyme